MCVCGRGGGGVKAGSRDAYAASQTTVLHIKRLNQTESLIFVIFLFQKAIRFDFYFTKPRLLDKSHTLKRAPHDTQHHLQ